MLSHVLWSSPVLATTALLSHVLGFSPVLAATTLLSHVLGFSPVFGYDYSVIARFRVQFRFGYLSVTIF